MVAVGDWNAKKNPQYRCLNILLEDMKTVQDLRGLKVPPA